MPGDPTTLPFFSRNKKAIEQFEKLCPDSKTAFRENPVLSNKLLFGRLGMVCARCGKNNLTLPNVIFYNFCAHTQCYGCQKIKY